MKQAWQGSSGPLKAGDELPGGGWSWHPSCRVRDTAMWAGCSSSSTAFTHPESWSSQPLAISNPLDGVSRSLWPVVWAEPGHTCVPPEEESAALSQDVHKTQEVLVNQETQAASFSKHIWLKPKSDFLVHCSNSPLSIYSSTGTRARCLQGLLESLLPVSLCAHVTLLPRS